MALPDSEKMCMVLRRIGKNRSLRASASEKMMLFSCVRFSRWGTVVGEREILRGRGIDGIFGRGRAAAALAAARADRRHLHGHADFAVRQVEPHRDGVRLVFNLPRGRAAAEQQREQRQKGAELRFHAGLRFFFQSAISRVMRKNAVNGYSPHSVKNSACSRLAKPSTICTMAITP